MNIVLIIKHNINVIKLADLIIDMGMKGRKGAGKILVKGIPEEVTKHKKAILLNF